MTPTQARAFLAVALGGSFSEAARALRISQPTVTNLVRKIEQLHGVELFYRSARGAALTPIGQTLLPLIRSMFGSFEEAGAYLDELRGNRAGHLRVGSYGPYDVMSLIAGYRRRFPAVSISVDFANSLTLAAKLLAFELDVAVLSRVKRNSKFYTMPFRNSPLVVIAPRSARWMGMEKVSVKELQNETFILREPGSAVRVAHDRLFGKVRNPSVTALQINSRAGVVSAVARGIGIGTIFDEGLLPEDRVIKLRIDGPVILSKVDLVCLAERRSNKLIAGFLDIVHDLP